MTKREFIKKFERLVTEYCRDNDYQDIEDIFDFEFQRCNYAVSLTINSENYDDDDE